MATLYNERHLAYDYSHYTVKIKLVTIYVCIITYSTLGAKLELAAVPAALIAVTIAIITLSACVWLANYLSTVAK